MPPADRTPAATIPVTAPILPADPDGDYEVQVLKWCQLIGDIAALEKQCASDEQQAQIEQEREQRAEEEARRDGEQAIVQEDERRRRGERTRREAAQRERDLVRELSGKRQRLRELRGTLEQLQDDVALATAWAGPPTGTRPASTRLQVPGDVRQVAELATRKERLLASGTAPDPPLGLRAALASAAALAVLGAAGYASAIAGTVLGMLFVWYLRREQYNLFTVLVGGGVAALLVVVRVLAGGIPLAAGCALGICALLGYWGLARRRSESGRSAFEAAAAALQADLTATIEAVDADEAATAAAESAASLAATAGEPRRHQTAPFAPLLQSLEEQAEAAQQARSRRASSSARCSRSCSICACCSSEAHCFSSAGMSPMSWHHFNAWAS